MDRLTPTPAGPVRAVLRVPGSKSITNRALICAALAEGTTTLTAASDSDDTRLLVDALRGLGFFVDAARDLIRVEGRGGVIPAETGKFAMGNAGTSLRFLTALASLGEGPYEIDGSARMRERPIGGLVDGLRQLGAAIDYAGAAGYPPLRVSGAYRGGKARIRGDTSSQFVSAILLAAPIGQEETRLRIEGTLVSRPYVDMTSQVLEQFGGRVEVAQAAAGMEFHVRPASYRAMESYGVESDGASANYFFALAAATGGTVTVEGIGAACAQGEVKLLDALERMGCDVERARDATTVRGRDLRGIDVDAADFPDSAQTLAVVALFAEGPTTIRGIENLRYKETDRLTAMAAELTKMGAKAEVLPEGLRVEPPAEPRGAEIDTYGDHRMAMSFAVAGARVPGVTIREPGVVAKSFPGFWETLRKAGLGITQSA